MHILSPLELSLPVIIFTITQCCQNYLISSDEETETQIVKLMNPRIHKLVLVRASQDWIQISASKSSSYVTWGKLPKFQVPQFLYLWSEIITIPLSQGSRGITSNNRWNMFSIAPLAQFGFFWWKALYYVKIRLKELRLKTEAST